MDYFERLKPILEYSGRLALELRQQGLKTEHKPDGSPVTNADKACNDFLVAAFTAAFPGDAIISEEGGGTLGTERTWIIDPIDNTVQFVKGEPYFNIIIGLLDKGEPVFGLMYYPQLNEWFWAAKGQGAFRVREGTATRFRLGMPHQPPRVFRRKKVAVTVGDERPYVPEYKQMLRTALGEVDAWINANINYWDTVAPAVIVREAGGVVVDQKGEPLRFDSPGLMTEGVFVTGHPIVVSQVIAKLNG